MLSVPATCASWMTRHHVCVQPPQEPAEPCYRQWCAVHFYILHIFLTGKTDNTPQVFILLLCCQQSLWMVQPCAKQNVQLALQQHQQWKHAVIDFLHVYHSTLHASTGSSPYELLHGRLMQIKLTMLPSVFWVYTAWRDGPSPQSQCPTTNDENLHQIQTRCIPSVLAKMGQNVRSGTFCVSWKVTKGILSLSPYVRRLETVHTSWVKLIVKLGMLPITLPSLSVLQPQTETF